MVENQCESNCEYVETQRSSGNSNVANECSCCCQTTTNKTNSIHAVVMTLLLGQNLFWKDHSLLHLQKYMWRN